MTIVYILLGVIILVLIDLEVRVASLQKGFGTSFKGLADFLKALDERVEDMEDVLVEIKSGSDISGEGEYDDEYGIMTRSERKEILRKMKEEKEKE